MKPVMSGPSPAITLGQAVTRLPRWWPIASVSVLAITVVVTVLQYPFPAVRLALWRDPPPWPPASGGDSSRPCSSNTTRGGRSSSCSR